MHSSPALDNDSTNGIDDNDDNGRDEYIHNDHGNGSGLQLESASKGRYGGELMEMGALREGIGAESVSSGKSQLSAHLMQAVRSKGAGAKREIASIKCTFGVAMAIAVTSGLLSLVAAWVIGVLVTDTSERLYLVTDQAVAFQKAEQLFRRIGAVSYGITPDPGPAVMRRDLDDFIATAYRHESRHTALVSRKSKLSSHLADKAISERNWILVEPSPSGGAPRDYNASLEELGTYLSSVLVELAEANETDRISFDQIESQSISQNREQYLLALNESISLRHLDVVRSFNFVVLLFSVVCIVIFAVVVGLAAFYVQRSLSSIREKTARVAAVAFMVPASAAKKLKQKTLRRLTQLAN